MRGQTKGWIIVGFDLLLVLGVYFVYLQFRPASGPDVPRAEVHQDEVVYVLEVSRPSKSEYKIHFELKNTGSSARTVSFPGGVQLMLSDRQRIIFWKSTLSTPDRIRLEPGEERSWSLTAPRPDRQSENLYASFYVDKLRQKFLPVPDEWRTGSP